MQQNRGVRLNGIVGRNVATYRSEQGLSQADLAAKLAEALGKKSIDPTTITRLEAGKRPTTVDELDALAEIFEVDASELIKPSSATKGLIQLRRFLGQLHSMNDELERLSLNIDARLNIAIGYLRNEPDLQNTLTDRDREVISTLTVFAQDRRQRIQSRVNEVADGLSTLIPTTDDTAAGDRNAPDA